jgi:hypothetical protein
MSYKFLSTILGIDANFTGNVGVGTTTPTNKLDVIGTSYFSTDMYVGQNHGIFFNGNGGYAMGLFSSGSDLLFQGGSAERMRLTSAGNLGLGTTNPQSELDIYRASNPAILLRDSSAIARLLPYAGNVYFQTAQAFSSGSTADLYFTGMYGTPVNMLIKATGNVLIGTTTDAGFKLDVNGNGRFTNRLEIGSSSNTGQNAISAINNDAGQATIYSYNYNATGYSIYSAQGLNYFAGNVGIGIGPNAYKLFVDGNIAITSNNFFRYDGDTGIIGSATSISGGNASQLGIRSASDILFGTNGSNERMRIASSGNVIVNNLSGSGTRMVVADASGTLSTQSIPTGTVTGSGTTNYVSKWSSSSSLTNSLLYDDGSVVAIGTNTPFTVGGTAKTSILGSAVILTIGTGSSDLMFFRNTGTGIYQIQTNNGGNDGQIQLQPYGGNVGINTANPTTSLDINGSAGITYSNYLYFGHNTSTIGSWQTRTYANGGYQYYNAYGFIFNNTGYGSLNFMTINGGSGNILINTTTDAGYKLDVNGTGRFSSNLAVDGITATGNRKLSLGILDLNSGGTPAQMRINTTIPFASGGADFTVNIKGFRYGASQMVSLSIGWHYYLSSFYNENAICNGAWKPTITLACDANGYVVIHLSTPDYWPKLYVESVYSSAYANAYSSGWNWTDANLSDCTNLEVVPYRALATDITGSSSSTSAVSGTTNYISKFTSSTTIGNSLLYDNGSNVGIGTTSPAGVLQVNGANGNGLIQAYVTSGGGNAIRINSNFSGSNYIDINPYISGVSNAGFEINQNGVQRFIISASGNLLIGTSTDSGQKLQVNGDSFTNGTIGIGGTNVFYFNTYGGGWYMSDTTYIRTYNDKTIWTGSGYLASQGGLSVGYGGLNPGSQNAIIAGNVGINNTAPVRKLDIVATAPQIRISDGSSGSFYEFYSVFSNTNQDLYIQNQNTVAIAITAPGNVGVGTNIPANKFVSVNNAAYNNENSYSIAAAAASDTAYKTVIGYDYSNDVGVISAVRAGITWKNLSLAPVGGKVLIGTITDSGAKLQVNGDASLGAAYLSNTDSTFNSTYFTVNSSYLTLGNNTADVVNISNNTMYFPGNGNVGIGETNPQAKLHIAAASLGSTQYDYSPAQNIFTYTGNSEVLEFGVLRTANGSDWTSDGFRIQEKVDSTWMGYMQFNGDGNNAGISFGTGASAASRQSISERMRITSSGNVLIGTTTDTGYKLQVAGSAVLGQGQNRPVTYDSFGGNFRITANPSGWATGYFFNGSSGTFRGGFGAYGDFDNVVYHWIGDDYNVPTMALYPNQGSVCIGTTTPLLATGGRGNLTINGSSQSILTLGVANNWKSYLYTDGTNTFLGAMGEIGFVVNGASISAMRMFNSGNVGVGTVTDNGNKLQVIGNVDSRGGGIKIGFNVNDAFTYYGTSTAHYGMTYGGSTNPVVLSGYFGLAFTTVGAQQLFISSSGSITAASLVGSGTRMVVADSTGTLSTQAIPGGGGISGSGTTNYISKWTGSTALGNSSIYDNGTNVGIGTASPSYKLDVLGDTNLDGDVYVTSTTFLTGSLIQQQPYNTNASGSITSFITDDNFEYNYYNNSYHGETIYGQLAVSVIAGQIIVLRNAALLWDKADASVSSPLAYNMIGIACADGNPGDKITILLKGFFASNSWYSSSPQYGAPMYLSPNTAGTAEDVIPSTTGNVVRIIGHIYDYSNANGVFVLRFNPDNFWLVI